MNFLQQLGITPVLLLTQIIGFLILMLLLWRFAFSSIFATLDQRQADIKAHYDEMDAERKRMEETRNEYEKRLAGIEVETRAKIQEAVKEAQALRDNLLSDARQQAEAIITQGRNDLERDSQQALIEMRQQIVTLAINAASKVVGENLNDTRHTRLVDDFIAGVGSGGKGNGTGKGIAAP